MSTLIGTPDPNSEPIRHDPYRPPDPAPDPEIQALTHDAYQAVYAALRACQRLDQALKAAGHTNQAVSRAVSGRGPLTRLIADLAQLEIGPW